MTSVDVTNCCSSLMSPVPPSPPPCEEKIASPENPPSPKIRRQSRASVSPPTSSNGSPEIKLTETREPDFKMTSFMSEQVNPYLRVHTNPFHVAHGFLANPFLTAGNFGVISQQIHPSITMQQLQFLQSRLESLPAPTAMPVPTPVPPPIIPSSKTQLSLLIQARKNSNFLDKSRGPRRCSVDDSDCESLVSVGSESPPLGMIPCVTPGQTDNESDAGSSSLDCSSIVFSKPQYPKSRGKTQNKSVPVNSRTLKFSIDNILKSDFGVEPAPCTKKSKNESKNEESTSEEPKPRRTGDGSSPMDLSNESSTPTSTAVAPGAGSTTPTGSGSDTPMLWPAWVYCTRYSDRPSSERVFSYLTKDEVEKMKQEEERKIEELTRRDGKNWSAIEDDEDDKFLEELPEESSINKTTTSHFTSAPVIRTLNAERRWREEQIKLGNHVEEKELSPAEERTLKAEKRAAWRQARLKSLEVDAMQAQMVIKKMSEMVDVKDSPVGNNNDPDTADMAEAQRDRENNLELDLRALRPTSDDFPKLALRTKDGPVKEVKESERVVGEKVTTRTEPYVDETGQLRLRTVEIVEKIIEREVETLKEKIISLELTEQPKLLVEGDDVEEDSTDVPPTPTDENPSSADSMGRRKKKKKTKKAKH